MYTEDLQHCILSSGYYHSSVIFDLVFCFSFCLGYFVEQCSFCVEGRCLKCLILLLVCFHLCPLLLFSHDSWVLVDEICNPYSLLSAYEL